MTSTASTPGAGRAPVLFLQSGVPGVTPYAGGPHLWGRALDLLRGRRALTLDLPGCGAADAGEQVPTVEAMAAHVVDAIGRQQLGRVHLVGHDVGALVALVVAMDHPQLLASVGLVASWWAAPSGDGVENFTLRHPPQPLWSAASQRWALERLSYSHLQVDDELVAQCERAAQQPAHRSAIAAMAGDGYARQFAGSATRAKFRFFQLARGEGLQVPVQVIAGMQDPLVGTAHMLSLFRIAGDKQPLAQFHIVNRAGSFPFREQPEEFMRVVQAFVDGLETEQANLAAAAAA
ncbi:alpha/beta hydrolase [Ramlibacter sp. AW1]|uniref:Alpha/beta hydrolase n=1 Tax=Ramlibacter aurantiacus TaxID=2801330 RepID=A0A936ZML2_9BURK|nr:alpha/beta hydrolase [Ramlibacter aurantiacus]MBL0422953.1 alpha/beta hydrolase [Ramlibacter aurantiacus]